MSAFESETDAAGRVEAASPSTTQAPVSALRPARGVDLLAGPSRRRKARGGKLRGVVAVLAVLLGAGALGYAFVPKPLLVDVGVVRRADLAVFVSEDGRTRVRERYVVSAPISGELTRIEFEPGDDVHEGDVLFRLVPPLPSLLDTRGRAEAESRLSAAEARRGQAKSGVAMMRDQYESALREGERARQLAPRGFMPYEQLERAELDIRLAHENLTVAELSVRAAEADVRTAQAVLGLVRQGAQGEIPMAAPASGRVLRVVRESGGPVLVGAPVIELGDVSQMEVIVDVLSSDALRIAPGARVLFEHLAEVEAEAKPLGGHVRRVEPSAFTHVSALGVEEQRVNVIVTLDQVPPRLGDGYRVDARILIEEAVQVLTVPASATFRSGDDWAVYAIRDGRAALQRVQLGRRARLDSEVKAGLDEGTHVVLYPSERIESGARVEARE